MHGLSRLAIVIADDSPERLRTGLVMAASHVALGGSAQFFLQGAAVALLRKPIADPDGERQSAVGLPTLAQLFEDSADLGIRFSACQSSLPLLGLTAEMFDPRIGWTGMIGFLSTVELGDRLIVI